MKTRIKAIALLLAVILTFPGALGGSAVEAVRDDAHLSPFPTESTTPTTEPPTQATTEPATVPPTSVPPTTVPPTTAPPTTVPPTTIPPTTVPPTTAPPETVPPATTPPETVPPATAAPETTAPPEPSQPAELTAQYAFVYDTAGSSFLFTHGNPDDRIYPASITKLFTALVALQHLSPEQTVTVGDALKTVPNDSSKAFLQFGDVLTVEQLVYGMLLPSGNDAARVLADAAGRVIAGNDALPAADAIDAFVAEMNHQAEANGLTGTHFVTPDGWHSSEHYTTMADLLTIARLCLADPLISQVVKTPRYAAAVSGRTLYWRNTNMHLHEDSEFYLPNCIGLKTGYTGAAGRCLLSAYLVDDNWVIMGVFNCPGTVHTYTAQFPSAMYLYNTYIAP